MSSNKTWFKYFLVSLSSLFLRKIKMQLKTVKILRHDISHRDVSRSMQLKWGDCITDDDIDGLIVCVYVCVCWSDILDTERAHIFDMYTREHSTNPARKHDRPIAVFAFSRKSRVRTVMISRPKISRDFSPFELPSCPLSTWNRIFGLWRLYRVCLMYT